MDNAGSPRGAPDVKLITGILYPDDERLALVIGEISRLWGEPEFISGPFPFDKTDYYRDIAPRLFRRFACFPGLIRADALAGIKNEARGIESRIVRDGTQLRAVNIDPGYIDGARLVLASTKDHAHRIYLRDGIYAEVTMRFKFGRWTAFDYTFPDFASGMYDDFLTQARKSWKAMRGASAAN